MYVFGLFLWLTSLLAWANPAQNPGLSELSVYQLNSQWSDAQGKSVRLADLQGRPRLVALLYTRCPSSCPIIVEDIRSTLKALPEPMRKELAVTLVSIDSEKETAETLKDFAKKKKLDANWLLLRGGRSEVATLAAALDFQFKRLDNGEYVHSNTIYLLDARGEIVARKEIGQSSEPLLSRAKAILSPAPSPGR